MWSSGEESQGPASGIRKMKTTVVCLFVCLYIHNNYLFIHLFIYLFISDFIDVFLYYVCICLFFEDFPKIDFEQTVCLVSLSKATTSKELHFRL